MLQTVLIVLLILFLLGGVGTLPNWPHSRNWGYGPSRRPRHGLMSRKVRKPLGRNFQKRFSRPRRNSKKSNKGLMITLWGASYPWLGDPLSYKQDSISEPFNQDPESTVYSRATFTTRRCIAVLLDRRCRVVPFLGQRLAIRIDTLQLRNPPASPLQLPMTNLYVFDRLGILREHLLQRQ